MYVHRCAELVQICLPTRNQFGSSKVPPAMPCVPGLLSAVQETVVPHGGQNSMRSQQWLSNGREMPPFFCLRFFVGLVGADSGDSSVLTWPLPPLQLSVRCAGSR